MIADQAQGEIEVFQFQVYSVVGLCLLNFFCSTVNIKIENLRQEETRRKGRSRQHFENYRIFHS